MTITISRNTLESFAKAIERQCRVEGLFYTRLSDTGFDISSPIDAMGFSTYNVDINVASYIVRKVIHTSPYYDPKMLEFWAINGSIIVNLLVEPE